MVRYPIVLTPDDNDTVLVSFPDFPEAHTFGENKEEARVRAVDALETVIDAYIRDRREIPVPSTGATLVTLPALMATKVQLYTAMRRQNVNKTELARRLGVHLPQVDRLLDVKHGSKLDQLEAAARALGGELEVSVIVGTPGAVRPAMPPKSASTKTRPATRAMRRRNVHPGILAAQKAVAGRWKGLRVGSKPAPRKKGR